MSQIVDYFQKRAKSLLAAVREGEAGAISRVTAVLRQGIEDFGLMKAQHVVAVEAGFERWNRLIEATENELRSAIDRHAAPQQPVKALETVIREHVTRRAKRTRLSKDYRGRLRALIGDASLPREEVNAEFRAVQRTVLELLKETTNPPIGRQGERQLVLKLIEDSTGDMLSKEATVRGFRACQGIILHLLDSYESSPARQEELINFTSWITRREGKDSPLGDLADDWLRDVYHDEPKTLSELLSHRAFRRAVPEADQVARRAWKTYEVWREKQEAELASPLSPNTASP